MLFSLITGNARNTAKTLSVKTENLERIKALFLGGRFPVTTTENVEGRKIGKVLGLVVCRAYDSEEAFFGMAARAVNKGAQAIIGYQENVAFHPDGSKFFSCYGTAVQFEAPKRFTGLPASTSAQPNVETTPLIM
jgi:uncharacterized protein YbjQ (UPF0145 family)